MTPEQQKVLMHLGAALLTIQGAERTIGFCLRCCLPDDASLSMETYVDAAGALQKRTLGQFLAVLRTRVDLDDSFDAVLRDFLERRNQLIHRADDIPGWDIATPAGCDAALQFIDTTFRLAQRVTFVFAGLARKWAEQNEIKAALPDDPFFVKLDNFYKPMVDELFFKKGERSGSE
jgi:hypothetical protein